MGTTNDTREFGYAGASMVRASPHAGLELPEWPDFSGTTSEHVASWRQWLQQVRALPGVAAALADASPDIAARMEAVCAAEAAPKAKRLRRIALAVARYLLRMRYRSTPFGLFAGVAPAQVGSCGRMQWGEQHQVVTSASAAWLEHILSAVEDIPALRERLSVMLNNAVEIRGQRLVLPHQPHPDKGGPADVSLRLTGPLQVVLDEARRPVPCASLAEKVAAECDLEAVEPVQAMLGELLRYRVLLSAVRAPSTHPAPLDHLVTQLDWIGGGDVPAAAGLVQDLREIRGRLDHGCGHRDELRPAMTELAATSGDSPLDRDLRLDCEFVLPEPVIRVAEHAAGLLARWSPHPTGTSAWRDWRERFADRYGTESLVPLCEVLHPERGIGYPAGFTDRSQEPADRLEDRDRRLLGMAQSAALDGQREMQLHEHPENPEDLRLPAHTELTLRVESASRSTLDSGRFRLVVLGAARDAGALTGRFARLLDRGDELAARLHQQPAHRLPVQVSFPPLRGADAHIARAPQLTEHVLAISEHRPPERGVLDLADLALGCDDTGLYLASYSLGRRITPVVPHALNLRIHTPPLVRFLCELPHAGGTVLTGFDWGAAARLPFLPRLRAGRIVLSSARWRLRARELPPHTAPWADWERALEHWADRRGVPELVELGAGDQRLRLDLGERAHRVLLRRQLDSAGTAVFTEAPDPGALGWCDGQPHEVVVPLTSVASGGGAARDVCA